MNDDAKQCLAFARVILQKPRWVVLDDVLDVLDPVSRGRIEALFATELADVGVINIGRDGTRSGFFTRTLHLVTDPHGPTFKPAAELSALAESTPVREALSSRIDGLPMSGLANPDPCEGSDSERRIVGRCSQQRPRFVEPCTSGVFHEPH